VRTLFEHHGVTALVSRRKVVASGFPVVDEGAVLRQLWATVHACAEPSASWRANPWEAEAEDDGPAPEPVEPVDWRVGAGLAPVDEEEVAASVAKRRALALGTMSEPEGGTS
jgi:hypothetical protein